MNRAKHALSLIVKLVLFLPLFPVGIVQWCASKIYDGCDWIGNSRPVKFLFRAGEAFDCWLGIDAESKYREWKERMRARGEIV